MLFIKNFSRGDKIMAVEWKVGDFLPERGQNRFEIKNIIQGGMGNIYVVYDHKLKEIFAAKTIRNEIIMRNREFYSNLFEQEALIWVNLDIHQNVAKARFFNYIGSTPVLFLEYVNGGDLGSWIGTHRLMKDIPQILSFAIQFCYGMIHVLSNGIEAHRDIKPQNCLVTSDRVLKVTDFGLARIEQERYGVGGGTPEYMAPEQWDSPQHANVHSDIYSFGAMLYAMLSGKPPFGERPHLQSEELKRKHKEEESPKLTGLQVQQMKRTHRHKLNEILITCLAKEPGERYENFSQIRKKLGKLYKSLTGQTPPEPITGIKLGAEEWQNKGLSLGHLGYYNEEITCCAKAIELAPQWANPWATKSAAFIDMGRFKEALKCAERATKIGPNHEVGWMNKGTAYSFLGQYEDAIKCFDIALKINPYYDMALLNKGTTFGNLGKYEEAIASIDKALAILPDNYKAFSNKSVALMALDRYEEAIACCDRAIKINPRFAPAWYNKGLALAKSLKDLRTALECFEEAQRLGQSIDQSIVDVFRQTLEDPVESPPNTPEECYDLGIALKMQGLIEKAISCFDRTLELDPNFDNALREKANALDELGRYKEAITCYNLALELNAKNEHTWYDKGVVLFELQMYEDALSCFSKAVEINSQNIQAWTNMATALSNLGRLNDAIKCYERVLSIDSEYEMAWYNMGNVLFHLDQLEEAIICFDRAIKIRPTYTKAWYSKGVILANTERINEAIQCFQEALHLGYPDAEQAIVNCRRALSKRRNNH